MKKKLLPFLILISINAISQPAIKVFAYSQVATPGIVPKVTDENGNSVNTKKEPAVNYYIFAAYSTSSKLSFDKIWIKGKLYSTITHKVESTPVINVNETIPSSPVKEVLVPATKQKVVSIKLVQPPLQAINTSASLKNMIKNNELVISYLVNGKKHFIGLKKIKILEPLAGI